MTDSEKKEIMESALYKEIEAKYKARVEEIHKMDNGTFGVCVECDAAFISSTYTHYKCSCGGDIDWMEEEIDW